MFDRSRRSELPDGRSLVVIYQGERFRWGAYVPGEAKRPNDRADTSRRLGGPDAVGGPDRMSLTEARANFPRTKFT